MDTKAEAREGASEETESSTRRGNMAMTELQIREKESKISVDAKGKVSNLIKSNQLVPQEGYNFGNAITAGLLTLRDTKDTNKRPVLEVCTEASIVKTLTDMVVQGLQPVKKQCYFIAYADQLTLFRSYFGTVVALKRAMPEVKHVISEVIYNEDKVEYGVTPFGERYVRYIASTPKENVSKGVWGGFCTIYDQSGEVLGSSIMTWDEIQTSWRQSRNYKPEGGVHQKFTEEMAKRTLIAKACKFLLNTSLENNAVVKAFNDTTDAEYSFEEQNEQKPKQEKVSFKERYGIGKEAEEAGKDKPKTDEMPVEAEVHTTSEDNGPESFEDSGLFDEPEISF